jgi:UPF0716 protein FxsA
LRLVALLFVFGMVELVLLLILADYTSWEVALLEILVSGLLGAAVIRYVSGQFGRRILSRLAASEFPGDTLADGAILFIAGVLLVLPGVMGDVAGLLLLIPPVRWLAVAWLKRRYVARTDAFHAQFAHARLSDDPSAGEVTLDCHVEDDHLQTGD